MSDPLDELTAPDVISGGSEDFGAFAESRWPGLVRLAFGLTGDRWAAEDLAQATLARAYVAWRRVSRADDPDAYLRRILVNSGTAGPGGVFASGVVDGHAWRLAVQDIADPGYRCVPAITVNGTDADPMYPGPQNGADVALGPAEPGVGFAFVQLPADVQRLVLDGRESLLATTATVCGQRYHVVGFAYWLTHQPQITAVRARPGWPRLRISADNDAQDLPVISELPQISTATGPMSQTEGRWNNVGTAGAETASAVLASGQSWSIRLLFGPGGDCYEFSANSPNNPDMGSCGPISTPDGPETIMALPLSYPLGANNGATGYALQVSPVTAHLRTTLSDGSTQLVTPQVVNGRRYAAFAIDASLRLKRLTWLNAAGQEIASTTALPRFGYTQFQP